METPVGQGALGASGGGLSGGSQMLLGIDIGGTSVRSLVVRVTPAEASPSELASSVPSFEYEILNHEQKPRPSGHDQLLAALAELAHRQSLLLDGVGGAAGATSGDFGHGFDSVGIGCAGFISSEGLVHHSPNIPSLIEFPLREKMEALLGCPVAVENDAVVAAWGEAKLGAGKGVGSQVMVCFGTGIGCAIIDHGSVLRGVHGFGSEPGHLTIVPDGLECPCGRRGCWERYASGEAFARLGQEAARSNRNSAILELAGGDPDAVTGQHIVEALERGDAVAESVFAELCDWIVIGLNNIVVLVDPELVILGGGLSDIGQRFLDAIQDSYEKRYTSNDLRPKLNFKLATHTDTAGAIGAALLSQELL